MNPFDAPPSGAPMSMPAPGPDDHKTSRGRLALVALLTAGLIGGGIAGVSQFASADEPSLSATAPDDTIPPVDDEPTDEEPADEGTSDDGDSPSIDGEIVIDTGDGDPIVLDLGDFGEGRFDDLQECLGLPDFDFDIGLGDWEPGEGPFGDIGELFGDDFLESLPSLDDLEGRIGSFEVFDGEGSVTVTGPDGVSVIDLGDNGSVTITKDGDDIVIDTAGDASVQELDELFGDFGTLFEPNGELSGSLDELFGQFDEGAFDEFLEGLPAFDELPEITPLDADQVEDCLADLRGG